MWSEVEKAKKENRHELVLGGDGVSSRIQKKGLDPHIFELTNLNYLDIHETNLKAVPDDVLKLSQLQSLVLYSNKLEEVNVNITRLQKLKLLDLSRNQLEEVPAEIDNLFNIVTFNFTSNSLVDFPQLINTQRLTVLNLSSNKLRSFPEVCREGFLNLSELKLSDNEIEVIPYQIRNLSNLKVLELSSNKIRIIPNELSECSKLKVLDLKNNPVSDRRLLKLIDQCRIKQIIDYVKAHCPKAAVEDSAVEENSEKIDSSSDEDTFKHTISVRYAKDDPRIIIDNSVKSVREYFLGCLINKVNFTQETFKKFIQIQNKLHETVCSKRNSATIATHDYDKLPAGDLHYTTLPPNELQIHPLNRATTMTGAELYARLQAEADALRKEKKRSTYSGIHKYLYLLEGRPKYPCLLHSGGAVISFPPITNSEISKIHVGTKTLLVEVTSSVSLHVCKTALDALLKELVFLLGQDLDVTQLKTTDGQGNLKTVYPSKADLNFDEIKVLRI